MCCMWSIVSIAGHRRCTLGWYGVGRCFEIGMLVDERGWSGL